MASKLFSLFTKAIIFYAGYKVYVMFGEQNIKVTGGASSEASHNATDDTEEASMDSFPASDPPAKNVFTL